MANLLADNLVFSATGTLSVASPPFVKDNPISTDLSGIVLNQNLPVATTLVDDITLPASQINVRTTVGFPASGQLRSGSKVIAYTDKTPTSFTGCGVVDFISGDPLSGVLTRGTQIVSERTDNYVSMDNNTWAYQDWRLPADYPRGTADSEIRIPELSGLQVDVAVETGYSVVAALDWRIDYLLPGSGWIGLAQGTQVGAPYDGDHVWFDISFEPIDITDIWTHRFRFGVRSRNFSAVSGDPMASVVPYDGTTVTVDTNEFTVVDQISPIPLQEGKSYPFDNDGIPALLFVEPGSGEVHYGIQQGVTKLWYTAPNPYAGNGLRALGEDGVTPVQDFDLNDVSFKFRILSAAPAGDIDCLGNDYRNVVVTNSADNVKTTTDDLQYAYWLSKPNPSEFGVETLYFDIRDGEDPGVVDHLLIDPVTPGVYYHIYYSNDPSPGTTLDEWDRLMWTRIDRTFQLTKRETIALPNPIKAKYLCIEFVRLQPRYYSPGTLRFPMAYRKHPKWVLDYYLAIYESQRVNDLKYSDSVSITYDAYDLAYNYFLDDIKSDTPNAPVAVLGSEDHALFNEFLKKESILDVSQVDTTTAAQISTTFAPFVNNPRLQGDFKSILASYASPTNGSNYSVESVTQTVIDNSLVSSLDREDLIIEKQFPVTSFYLNCRHFYRTSLAGFENDRAYFVGLKEVALLRDHYAVQYDSPLYIESTGDTVNIERNDFETVDQAWGTYSDAS